MARNGKASLKLVPWKSFKHESCLSHLRQRTQVSPANCRNVPLLWCSDVWPWFDRDTIDLRINNENKSNTFRSLSKAESFLLGNMQQVRTVCCNQWTSIKSIFKLYLTIQIALATLCWRPRQVHASIQLKNWHWTFRRDRQIWQWGRGHFLKWIYGSPGCIYIYSCPTALASQRTATVCSIPSPPKGGIVSANLDHGYRTTGPYSANNGRK